MKKLLLVLVAGVFFSSSITSCKKCGHCVCNGNAISNKICEKDDKSAYTSSKAVCVSPCVWSEE